jgi:uncharacterized membrane protein
MKRYIKEAILLVFVTVPFIYLASIWNKLPEQVPTHFRDGRADGWSSKASLLIITVAVVIGMYLTTLIIPILLPKEKIVTLGYKYYTIRLLLTLFISILMTYCLYISNVGKM